MGLPPPEIDTWVSFRNYGLVHSICSQYLKVCFCSEVTECAQWSDVSVQLLPNNGHAPLPEDSEDEREHGSGV